MQVYSCDVLVVGGGGAALRAAIAAQEYNSSLKVILATKGVLGRSGVTATACSDRMAFHATLPHTPPGGPDNWQYHAEDIYRLGGMVSDWDLAVILAKSSAEAYDYLDSLGVPFVKDEKGFPRQFVTDGSEYPRACYTGPKTAIHIEEALVRRLKELPVEVLNFTMIARLLVKEGRVYGALGIDTRERYDVERALKVIKAKAVILATGGGGLVFKNNVYPWGMTGDGYSLAYEAGAELVNLEFIQIGLASLKTKLNCSGSMLRAIPRFVNDRGEEFLFKYMSPGTTPSSLFNLIFRKGASWPVTYEHPTHMLDVAVYREIMAGRKVFLDYTQNPRGFSWEDLDYSNIERYFKEASRDLGDDARKTSPLVRLAEINQESIEWLKQRGVDLEAGDLIEVAPCIQHFQGGIKIRQRGETTIAGLYAAGEVAGGQHGANRPGGNALLDTQVFGRLAGEAAAGRALSMPEEELAGVDQGEKDEIRLLVEHMKELKSGGDIEAGPFRQRLRDLMDRAASVIRTEEGLGRALEELKELKKVKLRADDHGLAYALENEKMLLVAEMIVRSALLRDESRGPHLRFATWDAPHPLPRRDPEWQKYIVITRSGEEMKLEIREPVRPS